MQTFEQHAGTLPFAVGTCLNVAVVSMSPIVFLHDACCLEAFVLLVFLSDAGFPVHDTVAFGPLILPKSVWLEVLRPQPEAHCNRLYASIHTCLGWYSISLIG